MPATKEYNRRYYLKNKEKINKQNSEWYQNNKKRADELRRKNYLRNKNRPGFLEKIRQNSKKRYWENRDEKLKWGREFRKQTRIELLSIFGEVRCNKCPFSDWRALQIDHVFGGGVKELKIIKPMSSRKYKAHILKNKDNYQVLCANCNWIKRYENQELDKKA